MSTWFWHKTGYDTKSSQNSARTILTQPTLLHVLELFSSGFGHRGKILATSPRPDRGQSLNQWAVSPTASTYM
jgi:hypothetical protein